MLRSLRCGGAAAVGFGSRLRHRGRREVYESCSARGNPRLANSPQTDTLSSRPFLTTTFTAPATAVRVGSDLIGPDQDRIQFSLSASGSLIGDGRLSSRHRSRPPPDMERSELVGGAGAVNVVVKEGWE